MPKANTLCEYYSKQSIKPTHAEFKTLSQLESYAELRRQVFQRLMLPHSYFNGKNILEFGPDTGENSLVFALWGGTVTLVEPNTAAHEYIHRYFSSFDLGTHLTGISEESLLTFHSLEKFDLIDAEGFIYTIQPQSLWLTKTAELLKKHGLLVVSYMELFGSFIELLTKAIYQQVVFNSNFQDDVTTAQMLFEPKWNSIPHTRKFESWYMDVIKNPFVRKKYLIDPVDLLKDAQEGGFRLYSSFPNYKNVLEMQWIKSPLNMEEETNASIRFIEMSCLSHFLGTNCFSTVVDSEVNDALLRLVTLSDQLIEDVDTEACTMALQAIHVIREFVDSKLPHSLPALNILKMAETAFELIKRCDAQSLVDFCQRDKTFISNWGLPAHCSIFQKC